MVNGDVWLKKQDIHPILRSSILTIPSGYFPKRKKDKEELFHLGRTPNPGWITTLGPFPHKPDHKGIQILV